MTRTMTRTTVTRKQYKSRMDDLTAHLLAAQSERDDLQFACEAVLMRRGHEQRPPECDFMGERLNTLHDRIYDLEQEIRFLEDEWDTRHWTSQEWREWDLITSNID